MSQVVAAKGREVVLAYVRWFDSVLYQNGVFEKDDLVGPSEMESVRTAS